jgi:hypothetical protein
MANEQKKPTDRPNQPGQNPSGGSRGYQPGQQNPSGQNPSRRSDKWSDKGTRTPNQPSRQGDGDMDEEENPA